MVNSQGFSIGGAEAAAQQRGAAGARGDGYAALQGMPSHLTWLLKMVIYSWFTCWKWWFIVDLPIENGDS